jgi:hypothetical protein
MAPRLASQTMGLPQSPPLPGTPTAAVDRVGDLDPHAIRARTQDRFSGEAMVSGYERVYEQATAG